MTRLEAVSWALRQIYASKLQGAKCDGISIAGYIPNEIHVYRGAATLADALGVPYKITDRDSADYPHQISFMYEGYEFFQLVEKGGEDATDVRNS